MNVIRRDNWQILLSLFLVFVVVVFSCDVESASPSKKDVRKKETKQESKPKKQITNSIDMKLVLIPAGEFQMGSPKSEKERYDREAQHKVKITKSFYMATTEVTQKQWKTVMGTTPWKGKKSVTEGDNHPATFVSWNDTQKFIKTLNKKEGVTYRLPTEAEWEYACRAGTTTPFHFGSICNGEKCAINGDYPYGTSKKGPDWESTRAVGSYAANRFGLYDMHGNAFEWCSDRYGENYYKQFAKKTAIDPSGAASGSPRVLRGGSWRDGSKFVRSAFRFRGMVIYRGGHIGFRLVRVL